MRPGSGIFYYQHPSVCTIVSYAPQGWIPYEEITFPSVESQKYLRALGVTTIVVHGSLVEPEDGPKFSVPNLVKMGLKLVKAFPDGDAVYQMNREIKLTENLFLVPDYQNDKLELLAVTPEYYEKVFKNRQELAVANCGLFGRIPISAGLKR